MDVVVERPAALDMHKEQVTACVRIPGGGGQSPPRESIARAITAQGEW
jgi:hypothetical protein